METEENAAVNIGAYERTIVELRKTNNQLGMECVKLSAKVEAYKELILALMHERNHNALLENQHQHGQNTDSIRR